MTPGTGWLFSSGRHPNGRHCREVLPLPLLSVPCPCRTFNRALAHAACYAHKQSAGRRVTDQRVTPRVGLRNRVWGLKKPESIVEIVTALSERRLSPYAQFTRLRAPGQWTGKATHGLRARRSAAVGLPFISSLPMQVRS